MCFPVPGCRNWGAHLVYCTTTRTPGRCEGIQLYFPDVCMGCVWIYSDATPPFQVMAKGRKKSHISSQSAENENAVVVPLSVAAFRDVVLYDEMGDEHKILDQRHLVLHVTILGATDLKSVDCRRYMGVRIHLCSTWCYFKKICWCHVIHLWVLRAEIEPCVS